MQVYDFNGLNDLYEGLACVYFAFTSLSTVGFGDYSPQSDSERLFCSFILVAGVCVFSYLMDTFLAIISGLQDLNEDLDDGDSLTLFFGILKRFNGDKPINHAFKVKIEAFFDFKWNQDRLLALDDDEEKEKLSQLPEFVQDRLITSYLFSEFL